MKTVGLIMAAGSARRFGGDVPKQFLSVDGKPVLSHTVERFDNCPLITEIVVVVAEEYLLYTSEKIVDPYDFKKVTKIVPGGKTRQESVCKGLESLPISTDYVAIHDGARMLIDIDDISAVITEAHKEKAAILVEKVKDTVKRCVGEFIINTVDRSALYLAQTPQVFQYDLIIKAHREASKNVNKVEFTDDASLLENSGFKVKIVEASKPNFKITSKQDLSIAQNLIERK